MGGNIPLRNWCGRWRLTTTYMYIRDLHLVLCIKQPSFSINHKFWQLVIHNLEHGRKQTYWKDKRRQIKTCKNSIDELLLWIIQNPWENLKPINFEWSTYLASLFCRKKPSLEDQFNYQIFGKHWGFFSSFPISA